MRAPIRPPPSPLPKPPEDKTAAKPNDPGVTSQQPYATNHPVSEKDRKRLMKLAQEKAKKDKKAAAKAAKKPGHPVPPQAQPTPQPVSTATPQTPPQTPPQN